MRVAALQMVSSHDKYSNLIQAERLIKEGVEQGAELLLLPENFAVFTSKKVLNQAQSNDANVSDIRDFLRAQSSQYGVWLIAGSVPVLDDTTTGKQAAAGKVFTSSLVYSPEGVEVARYDKLHLFDVDVDDAQGSYRESEQFESGDEVVVAELPQCVLGLSICYDLRFPELYRRLSFLGANVMLVPAAFTYKTGEAHWQVLLQARAIENQCYIIAANQGGQHDSKRHTWGHSCIVNPWGEVIAQRELGEGVVVADLDLGLVDQLRENMPVLMHRRQDVLR